MEDKKYVILSSKAYESILNFLSLVPYKDVAQLISEVVKDASESQAEVSIVPKEQEKSLTESEPKSKRKSKIGS